MVANMYESFLHPQQQPPPQSHYHPHHQHQHRQQQLTSSGGFVREVDPSASSSSVGGAAIVQGLSLEALIGEERPSTAAANLLPGNQGRPRPKANERAPPEASSPFGGGSTSEKPLESRGGEGGDGRKQHDEDLVLRRVIRSRRRRFAPRTGVVEVAAAEKESIIGEAEAEAEVEEEESWSAVDFANSSKWVQLVSNSEKGLLSSSLQVSSNGGGGANRGGTGTGEGKSGKEHYQQNKEEEEIEVEENHHQQEQQSKVEGVSRILISMAASSESPVSRQSTSNGANGNSASNSSNNEEVGRTHGGTAAGDGDQQQDAAGNGAPGPRSSVELIVSSSTALEAQQHQHQQQHQQLAHSQQPHLHPNLVYGRHPPQHHPHHILPGGEDEDGVLENGEDEELNLSGRKSYIRRASGHGYRHPHDYSIDLSQQQQQQAHFDGLEPGGGGGGGPTAGEYANEVPFPHRHLDDYGRQFSPPASQGGRDWPPVPHPPHPVPLTANSAATWLEPANGMGRWATDPRHYTAVMNQQGKWLQQQQENPPRSASVLSGGSGSGIGSGHKKFDISPNPEMNEIIADETLASLTVKELNKRVQNLPREKVVELKQRRRTLKNRGYAMNCRLRRQQHRETLEHQVEKLVEELRRVKQERDYYKARHDKHQLQHFSHQQQQPHAHNNNNLTSTSSPSISVSNLVTAAAASSASAGDNCGNSQQLDLSMTSAERNVAAYYLGTAEVTKHISELDTKSEQTAKLDLLPASITFGQLLIAPNSGPLNLEVVDENRPQ